jgi:glutamate carboxypeptidase
MLGAEILERVRDEREAMVSFLRELTLAESPSSNPATQPAVRELLAHALEGINYRTIAIPGRCSGGQLYARPRGRRKAHPLQLIIGHYDSVWPVGTLADMPFDYDGQVVKGPGVFDMKGGLVQLVFALKTLDAMGQTPSVTPLVFCNSDEEIGSRESGRYIRVLARLADRALVLEPSLGPAGAIKTARKGVGRYTVEVRGKAAHAGLDPEGGASAILELSFVIQKLFALNHPERGITVNVGTIDGGVRPNVVAPLSTAVVDVRVATREDAQGVDAAIRGLQPDTPGVTLHIQGGIGRPALEPTPRNQALWARARTLGEQLGLSLEQGAAGGGSDGNTTSLYTATLDGLGPVGDGAHAQHEHLDMDRTIERCALLALLLLEPPLGVD